jgi:hypothetical protein
LVTFETVSGDIDETWFTLDNTTTVDLVLEQLSDLQEDSSVLIKINGYIVGDNMPELDMEFTITV